MKILIGGPVRQEPDIFAEYIKSVRALKLPESCTVDCHFIFNECDLSHLLQPNETYEIINTGSEYICNEKEHVWSKSNYDHMSFLRNHILDKSLYAYDEGEKIQRGPPLIVIRRTMTYCMLETPPPEPGCTTTKGIVPASFSISAVSEIPRRVSL